MTTETEQKIVETPEPEVYGNGLYSKKHPAWGDLQPHWLERHPPKEHREIVFDLVDESFAARNIYPEDDGLRPNAKYIASQHGCLIHFVHGEYEGTDGVTICSPSYYGLTRGENGKYYALSMLVSGDTRAAIVAARNDILSTFRPQSRNIHGRLNY